MDEYQKQLVIQSNISETTRLETKLENFDSIAKAAGPNGKDLVRDDENRLAKEIDESMEREKKYT